MYHKTEKYMQLYQLSLEINRKFFLRTHLEVLLFNKHSLKYIQTLLIL